MTGYLRAARVCRALAVLAALATVRLIYAGHPWWAALTAWAAFLALFLGGRLHLAHNRTLADRKARNRRTLTDKETTTT